MIEKLINELESARKEYNDFIAGNTSACARARKCLQNIKKIAQEIRLEIQNKKNADKAVKKAAKANAETN